MAEDGFKLAGDDTLVVPPSRLSGRGWADHLATGMAPSRMKLAKVYLTPGSHTSWHRHPRGQLLHVLTGNLIVQERDQPPRLYLTGETAVCTPDVEHWHGADPRHFTIQLAVVEADERNEDAVWGEMVTREEYAAALEAAFSV
jgi:quercetin dioxygenase-like cupin family protein